MLSTKLFGETYQLTNVYENRNQAKDWLKQNQIWSFVKAYDTEAGRKEMYRCNIVKTRGPQCGGMITSKNVKNVKNVKQ